MSRLEELINRLCPDGVEYKKLGEIGIFYGGLTGKSKDDFVNGNAVFITYKNIYANPSLDMNITEKVKVGDSEKQNIVQYGDVLFTGSSETPDECALTSVITIEPTENMYLNSFCFGLRFFDKKMLLPDFCKHLFRADFMRNQLAKTASGVTRFNVSKDKMKKVEIPVPPLQVQEEIVRILDTFTELETELETELKNRKRQYEYYKNQLLSFVDTSVDYKTLKDISSYAKERVSLDTITNENYVGVENLLQDKKGKTLASYLPKEGNVIGFKEGDILIGNIRPYLRKIWLANISGGTNGDVLCIRINDRSKVSSMYLYYVLSSEDFFIYLSNNTKSGKMPRGDKDAVMKYRIPIPSLSVQEKIVSILNKFDTLCNSITQGLPKELELRRKQYEYYRDKLLTFKRKEVV